MLFTCMYGVFAGHEGGSGGCAQRRCVVVVENHAVVGEGVDVWSWDLIGAVKPDIVPSL